MSYKFRSAQTDYITLSSAAFATTGTMSFWWKAPFSTGGSPIAFYVFVNGNRHFVVQSYSSAFMFAGYISSGGADGRVFYTGTPTDNTWIHTLLTWSPTASKLYLSGVQAGSTNTTDGTFDTTGVAKLIGDSVSVQPCDQYIAEMGYWNAILSGADIADLATGRYPNCITTNLVSYWALSADATDTFGSDNGTATGAAVNGDHPTMIACGGGGGTTLPVLIHSYRRRHA